MESYLQVNCVKFLLNRLPITQSSTCIRYAIHCVVLFQLSIENTVYSIDNCNNTTKCMATNEWPSGLKSSRQMTEVKFGRVRSNSGWVTSEA